jgi:hypothetical protein
LKERAAQRGAHERGADGGDARTEFSAEKGSSGRKPVRWTPGRWGRACVTRVWMDETDGAQRRKIRPAGGGSVLTLSGGEGAWRGGCRVEAERKRERESEGALGAAWSSAAVCHRRGSGPAVARVGGAFPRDGGGRQGRRDAIDVADRWAGT